MPYTEKELSKLIEAVETEFSVALAKAEADFRLAKSENDTAAPSVDGSKPLAKAEDEKPAEAKEEKEEPKSEEKPAEESKEAPAAEPKAEENAEGAAEQAAPAAEAPAPGSEDAHGYDAEDLAHLEEMYGSMSRAELMAHHDAVKNCLDAMGAAEAAPAVDAPMAPEAAPAAPEAPAAPMQKSEKIEAADAVLLKSELDAEKAKSADLKKNLDAVSEFLTKLVSKKTAPAGKAITNVDTIAKSEIEAVVKTFTKSEVTAILTRKAADPKLTKSDRELINAYYGAGQVSIENISHLLK